MSLGYLSVNTRDSNASSISTETLCDLIRMILTMNNFSFNDKPYLQTHGTAMETRMAPSYANHFLAKFETYALSRAPFQPFIWPHYIDDIFMIWTRSVQDLNTFRSSSKDIHPTIKFTYDYSFSSIPFLDVNVSLLTMAKSSLTFTRNLQTNTNSYYIRPAIPYTPNLLRFLSVYLFSRFGRICSTNETFTLRTDKLIDYLYKLGYNRYFLQREIQRVNNITRTEALTPHDTSTLDKQESVPLLLPTTQPFVQSHPLFANTFTSLFHSPVAITSSKLHPL